MLLSPAQCRAARGLLNWSQRELVETSGVSHAAIANFERGASTPYARTLKDLRETFEKAGVEFLAEGSSGGIGVRLRTGVQEPQWRNTRGEADEATNEGGLSGTAWSAVFGNDLVWSQTEDLSQATLDQRDFWRARPEHWQTLSDISRHVLVKAMRLDRATNLGNFQE